MRTLISCDLAVSLLLLTFGIASPAKAQTGVDTLNGGTANQSSLTEITITASGANAHGVDATYDGAVSGV